MRRVIIGLTVSMLVVAGLPTVVSAGNGVEHPAIDCYAGSGFNSDGGFATDIDWGFPCLAYPDGHTQVGETSATKLYTLWDGSRKLVAYFHGSPGDLGLYSGDECRLPDGTTTFDTKVRWWWGLSLVICKAPPVPECSTTLPTGLYAWAWIDFGQDNAFTPGTDVWIAAWQEGSGDINPSADDLLLTNCYPTSLTPGPDDVAPFGESSRVIDSATPDNPLIGVIGGLEFKFITGTSEHTYVEDADQNANATAFVDAIGSNLDLIKTDPDSLSEPQTLIPSTNIDRTTEDYFIDVIVEFS